MEFKVGHLALAYMSLIDRNKKYFNFHLAMPVFYTKTCALKMLRFQFKRKKLKVKTDSKCSEIYIAKVQNTLKAQWVKYKP